MELVGNSINLCMSLFLLFCFICKVSPTDTFEWQDSQPFLGPGSYPEENNRGPTDKQWPEPMPPTFENKQPVLRLDVCDLNRRSSMHVIFNMDMFMRFQLCMCGLNSKCGAVLYNGDVVFAGAMDNTVDSSNKLAMKKFLCEQINSSTVQCSIIDQDNLNFKSNIWVKFYCKDTIVVRAFWNENMSVSVKVLDVGTVSIYCDFYGNSSCFDTEPDHESGENKASVATPDKHYPTSSDRSKINSGNNEDVPKIIIGIVVSSVIVIIIIILVVLKHRRKPKAGSSTKINRDPKPFPKNGKMVAHGIHRQLHDWFKSKPMSSSLPPDRGLSNRWDRQGGNGTAESHTRNNTYITHSNADNGGGGISNASITIRDNMYASIDDALGIRSEYSALGEFAAYSHLYKAVRINDPKQRPAMPLPSHVITPSLPYYSVTHPTATIGSVNQESDATSTQYLELIDQNAISNQSISGADYLIPISSTLMTDENVSDSNSYLSLIPNY